MVDRVPTACAPLQQSRRQGNDGKTPDKKQPFLQGHVQTASAQTIQRLFIFFCQALVAFCFAGNFEIQDPSCLFATHPRLAPNSNFLHSRSQFHSGSLSLSLLSDLSYWDTYLVGTLRRTSFATLCQ